MSAVSLRPYLPADARRCAEIFRSSINELAGDDYDEEQREAWASRADDEQAFGARLTGTLTLLAMIDGAVAGFASLKGADHVDMLFVDPEHMSNVRWIARRLRVLPLPVTLVPFGTLALLFQRARYDIGDTVAIELQRAALSPTGRPA